MDGDTNGETTLGDLFDREPRYFGLRGDAELWKVLRERFKEVPLPHSTDIRGIVENAIEDELDIEIPPSVQLMLPRFNDDVVYDERFDVGGMSGGAVFLSWWCRSAIPILIDRCEAAREATNQFEPGADAD